MGIHFPYFTPYEIALTAKLVAITYDLYNSFSQFATILRTAEPKAQGVTFGAKARKHQKFDIEMQCAKDEYASRLMYKPYMTASARKSDKAMRSITNFYHLL